MLLVTIKLLLTANQKLFLTQISSDYESAIKINRKNVKKENSFFFSMLWSGANVHDSEDVENYDYDDDTSVNYRDQDYKTFLALNQRTLTHGGDVWLNG